VTATNQRPRQTKAGDLVVVSGHRLGEVERVGEILEVIARDGAEHYRVHWDDEHESLFYPGSDTTIKRKTGRRSRHET
jgi:uncharacterized protein DUF1918